MMRYFFLLALIIAGCANADSNNTGSTDTTSTQTPTTHDQRLTTHDQRLMAHDPRPTTQDLPPTTHETRSNQRFRDVTVARVGKDSFRVHGEAQIFEASFGWVVEDGHNELAKGFTTADAGAPEWGDFNFIIKAPKQKDNSTLHLILFETSMKDGSRVHELPIPLPDLSPR